MSDRETVSPWETLLLRYAADRQICNCRKAYYDAAGSCKSGCQANQSGAQSEIARRVVDDFGIKPPPELVAERTEGMKAQYEMIKRFLGA